MKYWALLLLAGVFECIWALGLKYTEGFTKLGPTLWTAAAVVASFYLMSLVLQKIPIGTAYAVWTGIGIVGVAAFGVIFLGESKELSRLFCIFLILFGIVGLKLVSVPVD